MNLSGKKENVEALSKIVALILAISYGLGFLLWNVHLSSYGYFEYDLLQTRFIFSGIVTLLLTIPFAWLVSRLLKIGPISKWSNIIKIIIFVMVFLVASYFFIRIIFPYIPQHLGGARPFAKSIIADPGEIEFLSNFNIPSAKNADGKKSVQTDPVCEIYSSREVMIVGTVGENGLNLRVLNIKKDKVRGFQAIPLFEEEKYREAVCTKFFYRIKIGALSTLFKAMESI